MTYDLPKQPLRPDEWGFLAVALALLIVAIVRGV